LIIAGLAAATAAPALAQEGPRGPDDAGRPGDDAHPPRDDAAPHYDTGRRDDSGPRDDARPAGPDDTGPSERPAEPYSRNEIVDNVSDFFGVTAENAGAAIERVFRDNGRPTAYIAGTEGSGAFFLGLRYGQGLMYMKERPRLKVYWQGPTGGFDWGADGARVFTLCYNLQYPDAVFRRFPGVTGSAFLIGGMGVNYQRAEDITLVPIRVGGGVRLGASLGYLSYSRKRNIIPL
jgi:hypothetical protein